MFRAVVTFRARIDMFTTANETGIALSHGAAKRLDSVGVGNHTYLILRGPGRAEVVKYHHTADYLDRPNPDYILVERGIEGGQHAFGEGDCIEFVWTESGILELMAQQKHTEGI